MEVKEESPLQYRVERTDDISVLSDFYCGVAQMDNFIHNNGGLNLYMKSQLTNTWIVREEKKKNIVGFFALSKNSLRLNSDDIKNVDTSASSSLKAILEEIESFPALRLDYIAIHKDFRKRGLGSRLLE